MHIVRQEWPIRFITRGREGEEKCGWEEEGKGRRGMLWMVRGGHGGMWYLPHCTLVFSDSGIVLRYLAGNAEEDGGSSCVCLMVD